jgi:hypothetical protein
MWRGLIYVRGHKLGTSDFFFFLYWELNPGPCTC